MTIRIEPKAAAGIGSELLDLSRELRNAKMAIGDARNQISSLSDMGACGEELKNRENDLALLTSRLVALSSCLQEVAELYAKAEDRSADKLDGESAARRNALRPGTLYESDGSMRERLNRILYQ